MDEVVFIINSMMFASTEEAQISDDLLEDADTMQDEGSGGCWPWEMVVRWSGNEDIDMNGIIFDSNVNLLGVTYYGNREQIDGKVYISEDVLAGNNDGENSEKLSGDWSQLFADKQVAFIAVVIHVYSGENLGTVMGCKLGCECKDSV